MSTLRRLKNLTYLSFLDFTAKSESITLTHFFQKTFTNLSKLKQFKLILPLRFLLQTALPNQPLNPVLIPSIELLITCTISEKEKLKLAVTSAKKNSLNEISQIRVICPASDIEVFKLEFPDFVFETDEQTLGVNLVHLIRETFSKNIHGWITQQCVKFLAVLNSNFEAVLILDADTVLLKPLVFIDASNKQILSVSYEYHYPYASHANKMWGDSASSAVSFVTHYQLQQKSFVAAMFPENKQSIQKWLSLADKSQKSAISEYHCYGAWTSQLKPSKVMWHKWNNRAIAFNRFEKLSTPQLTLEALTKDFPNATSLSFHGYL